MPTATISTSKEIQTSNFNVIITFDAAVAALPKAIVILRTIYGNGVTGVDFSVMGSGMTRNLMFTLPSLKEGGFEISIDGDVTVDGTPETVVVMSPLVVHYDTTENVSATFGTPKYREGGVIVVPVTFAESVIASKTVFQVKRISGDALDGMTYIILGEGTKHEFRFTVPPDRKGRFEISADGNVLKTSTGVWDNVIAAPLTVPYDTTVPEVVDHRVIRTGERVDVILQYGTRCTLNDPVAEFGSDMATYDDFLDYGGQNLDTPPNFYRKADNDFPPEDELPLPYDPENPLEIPGWTQDTLQETEATIYLIRFGDVPENMDFNVELKSGFVRGPVVPESTD